MLLKLLLLSIVATVSHANTDSLRAKASIGALQKLETIGTADLLVRLSPAKEFQATGSKEAIRAVY